MKFTLFIFERHDTTTIEGRGKERYQLAAWATLTSIASRGLSMLLMVLGVSLTVSYLGTTRFGIWATLASMTAMLSLLDLGIGNALVNRVAQAAADNNQYALQRIVSGGAGWLAVVGLAATSVLLLPALWLPWGKLLKLTDAAMASEARQGAVVFSVIFGINLIGSGFLRILAGQQRSYEANLLSACATAFACAGLYFASKNQAAVPWLLAVTFGLQTLGGLAAGVLLLRRNLISVRGVKEAMVSEWPHLLRIGSLFVLLQLGTMIGWGADSMIIAVSNGAAEVTVYAVAYRLFQFASQPFAMLNAPLWGAYADASARCDTPFIRKTLKRSFYFSVLGTVTLSSVLLIGAPAILTVWTHNTIEVPIQLLVLFAIWSVLDAGGNAFGVYLNGTGIVREQVLVVTTFCLVALPLKLYASWQAGAIGLVAAAVFSYILVVIGLYTTVFRRSVFLPLTGTTK